MAQTLLEIIVEHLQARKGTFRALAKETGVPYSTLHKISQGWIKNPGINHVDKIAKVIFAPTNK